VVLPQGQGEARAAPTDSPPFIDRHRIRVDAPARVTWAALERYACHSLGVRPGGVVAWLLGTVPARGFHASTPDAGRSLALTGRHRFSQYRLVFHIDRGGAGGSEVSASSYAAFPGVWGRLYRALVVGSGLHIVATRRILRGVRDEAESMVRRQGPLPPQGGAPSFEPS
jgi:hypothetical protein